MGLRIPCLRCGKFEPDCKCPPLPVEPEPEAPPVVEEAAPAPPETVKMRREKRAGGREVVILEGFSATADLDAVLKELKKNLGTGGSAKDGTIEIQGDHRDRIAAWMKGKGWRAVRAGG